MGSELAVREACDGGKWLLVRAPDGYEAWARSWGTVPLSDEWSEGQHCVIREPFALLHVERRDHDMLGVVSSLGMGCRLRRIEGDEHEHEDEDGELRVATPDGREGWISSSAATSDETARRARFWEPSDPMPTPDFTRALASAVLTRALMLVGVGYRWGGASASGVDCSGLMRLAFGLEGIALPRDARDQAVALAPWRIEEPASHAGTGDLVFFGESLEGADHVAIGCGLGPCGELDRPGRILHASGRVRISSLDPADEDRFEPNLLARACAVIRPPWRPGGPRDEDDG